MFSVFFFSSRRRHTRCSRDWSSDVCSSDLYTRSAMTERKPPGRSWESWLEEQIRQAREDGAFDNLEGAGKPLPDLDQGYDPDWWVKKLIRREKGSVLPPALGLLRKVEVEMARIWTLRDEAEVR